jgi:uncharacterized membrane protein YhiD involved in acid resistance
MNTVQDIFQAEKLAFVYGPTDILLNICLAFALGMVISYVYKQTHRGLSYSQSFMLTLVFVTVIVSIVMMIIGNNLARAFALVGALSIIRFRTVVKDTKDTAYVFLALAAGMASGTSSYFLALVGVSFTSAIAFVLHTTNYGSLYKSEFVLRLRAPLTDEPAYSPIIDNYTQRSNLLHIEPSGDGQSSRLTFDIVMKKDLDPNRFSSAIAALDGINEVVLVASKSDVDY